ncbi:MAG: hypothetical protein LBS42_00845 [Tannerella sp.]|nr:hypothetical protein [Tannerella sp.]
MKKTILLLAIALMAISCGQGEGINKLNKAYTSTLNVFDYLHDYSKYPQGWYIVSKIKKSFISEIDYDIYGNEKPKKKKIPVYMVYYSTITKYKDGIQVVSPWEKYLVKEYRALKIRVGDVVTRDGKKITFRMDPIILASPTRVEYTPPTEPFIGKYIYDRKGNPENQKLISQGKILDYARYHKEGIKGPLCIVSHVNAGAPGGDPIVSYVNKYGLLQSSNFPHNLVSASNLKCYDVIEIQWEGRKMRFKKLPFYATDRPK